MPRGWFRRGLYRARGLAKGPAAPAGNAESAVSAGIFPGPCAPLSLKIPSRDADGSRMFSATKVAGSAGGGRLHALRLSLNTPVVAIRELPVGPASAGVAVHEGRRGYAVCLAVRSVRGGQVVVFAPEGGWDPVGDPSLGMDAALSFAEGMGFLFDEDLIVRGEAGAGAERWAELLRGWAPAGDPEPAESAAVPRPLLSKFRLRPVGLPVAEAPGAGRDDVWLRLLSRF